MSRRAWAYVWIIILLGLGVYLYTWGLFTDRPSLQADILPRFLVLTVLMTAAQMFRTEAATHEIYHPNLMFALAGVLTLPPHLFGSMILISHLIEWGKERTIRSEYLKAWYLQPFNISMHILVGWVTYLVHFKLIGLQANPSGLLYLIAALVATLVYMLLNHACVAMALVIARRVPWRDSGILEKESLLIDLAMLAMGITVAKMVEVSLWLILPAMAPLYPIYRALAVPNLQRQASSDSKTGLWNAEYFRKTLEAELNRALRFNRPLVVVMADLDLLRNINNVYGHLAGDTVLTGVAEILKENLRDFDTVARFGGEEFSILMPETTIEQAYPRIEAVRRQIEMTTFIAPKTNHKIHATMSFGITGLGADDKTTIDVVHRADLAVYAAKIRGRNQTCLANYPEGSSISLEERIGV